MKVISSSSFKKSNKNFLMKEEQIKTAISTLFYSQKIKWQYLQNSKNVHLINITKVVLSKDYSSVKIFISLYSFVSEDKNDIKLIATELNKEAPLIRKLLGQELALRRVPNLIFMVDSEFHKIQKVEELLDNLRIPNKTSEK